MVRGRARTFSDPRSVAYEKRIAWLVANATHAELLAPAGVPVRVDVLAIFKRPKRLHRKADPPGLVPHVVRPDLDNVVKSILDGIGIAGLWDDDGQVTVLRAEAAFSEKDQEPRVELTIYLPAERPPQGKTLIEVFDALPAG
jgi:Holliday junction resolvase RusA-like endonuclease